LQNVKVAPAALADIALGRTPGALQPDEAVLYAFCTELHRHQGISDATWAQAVALWGEQGSGRPDRRQRLLHLAVDGDEQRPHHGAGLQRQPLPPLGKGG
jgi:4-carboxymuconolactone decarboxylase